MSEINHSSPEHKAEDLQRYHRGELTNTEMHHLEKSALTDPFLSDALDGFSSLPPYNKDELRRKIVTLQYSTRISIKQYLSIAAALTAVILSVLFFSKNRQSENPIVFNPLDNQKSTVGIQDTQHVLLADNLQKEKDWNSEIVPKKNTPNQQEKKEDISVNVIPKMTSKNENITSIPKNNIQEAKTVAISSDEAMATVSEDNLKKDNQPEILKTHSPSVKTQRLSQFENTQDAYPENGWEAFKQYVKVGLSTSKLSESEKLLDYLTVRFSLNEEGKPDKIDFYESSTISAELQKTIIVLIQKGPKWIDSSHRSGGVEVKIQLR